MDCLTAQALLEQNSNFIPDGPTIAIDAEIELKGEELYIIYKTLEHESSLTGLTVVTTGGQVLGVISRFRFESYHQALLNTGPHPVTRGGSVDTLGGISLSEIPLYRCNRHEPSYQCISWDIQPKCRTCGYFMALVK